MFPAAWTPWTDTGTGETLVHADKGSVPIVAVGALNPNGTDALFSNAGPWVRAYAPGAAVMSTLPPFQGGLLPMARTETYGRTRESIDPDDYTGRFALWSGTSFAAPVFAGLVECQIGMVPLADDSASDALSRGWAAIAALTDLTP
jgi:subtilisin family serine protease